MVGTQSTGTRQLTIVGAGPRGISLLERIGAVWAADPSRPALTVHLVDDSELGAGRIWRTDQTPLLCMNTLAGAVTLFPEEGSSVQSPVRAGPTLYEWGILSTTYPASWDARAFPREHVELFAKYPPTAETIAPWRAELAQLRPDSHPSRALFGQYLRWVYRVARDTLPARVTVIEHSDRAVGFRPGQDQDEVVLRSGAVLRVDATVAALGWLDSFPHQQDASGLEAAHTHALHWVAPANPIDQDLSELPAGETVIVRGLGMGFFDAITLLTLGRGGAYQEDPERPHRLRYTPSGREPHILATSWRGYPYFPKSVYGGLQPPGALPRTRRAFKRLDRERQLPGSIDLDSEFWPEVVRDAAEAAIRELIRHDPGAANAPLDEIVQVIDHTEGTLGALHAALAETVPGIANALPLKIMDPLRMHLNRRSGEPGHPTEPTPVAQLTGVLAQAIDEDLREADTGADSIRRVALWEFSAARRLAHLLARGGRLTATSHQGSYRSLIRFGGMIGSGPPARRTRELLALIEAGVVSFLGGQPTVTAGPDGYQVQTAQIDAPVRSRYLVEAWMHQPDPSASTDPFVRDLVGTGSATVFQHGDGTPGHAFTVDIPTGRAIRSDGTANARLWLAGIPLEDFLGDTMISPMPGSDPTMLIETDRIVRSLAEG